MTSEVNIKGMAELDKLLAELPDKLQRNVVRGALRAGAKVIEDEAKRHLENNNSVHTGRLRDSIHVSVRVKRGVPVATIKTGGPGKVAPFYGHMVEFGTARHLIAATGVVNKMTRRGLKQLSVASLNYRIEKGVLAFGSKILGTTVEHPGSMAKPFMRPALDAASGNAVLAFGEYVKKRLTKQGLDTPEISLDDPS